MLGRVVGMPASGHATVNDIQITEGTSLDPAVPTGVVVEQHMAAHFELSPGDTFSISTPDGWTEVEVLGVAASPEYLWPARSRQEVLVLPDDFGVVFAPEAFVASLAPNAQRSEVLFRLADDASAAAVEAAREAVLAAGAVDAYTLEEQPSNAALQEDVAGFAEMSVMFPAFFLIAAAFATYVMLGRMISGADGQHRHDASARLQEPHHPVALRRHRHRSSDSWPRSSASSSGALLAEGITRLYTGVLSIPAAVVDVRARDRPRSACSRVCSPASWRPASRRVAPAASRRRPPCVARCRPVAVASPSSSGSSRRCVGLPVRWLSAIRGLGRAAVAASPRSSGVMLATMLIIVSWGMIDTHPGAAGPAVRAASSATTRSSTWPVARPTRSPPTWPPSRASTRSSWHWRLPVSVVGPEAPTPPR